MKSLFLRQDLRTKNKGWIRKVNYPMKMAKINGNTDTEAFIDSVRMFTEGKSCVKGHSSTSSLSQSDLGYLHRARNCNLTL